MVSKRRFACFEMALSEGDEGYSLVPHQGTGPIRLREVRRSSMGCNIEAIKPFVKQGPLRLVRCLAERQTSRHLSKRLLPIVLFTLEEFVMLDVWSLAKLAHSYLLTIDYRVSILMWVCEGRVKTSFAGSSQGRGAISDRP